MKNKYAATVINGIIAGIFLSVGCAVYLSCDNKIAGAFMFSLGLFAIITFRLALYTGKAGYMAVKPPKYIIEVLSAFLGNALGTAAGGTLLRMTKLGGTLTEKAAAVMQGKFTDSPLSIFILAVFCGVLMYTAVEGNKKASEKGNHIGALFIVVLPVMVFITCGFNHSVADLAYFFISGCAGAVHASLYFLLVVTGNAAGCMLIPFLKRIIGEEKVEK
ncbi:MAG: formate/nitrite transporter family protein [Candidatus Ornithomonoglobus sp.]